MAEGDNLVLYVAAYSDADTANQDFQSLKEAEGDDFKVGLYRPSDIDALFRGAALVGEVGHRRQILDHADELAKRFEDYEPDPADERPVEEYLLERAVLERARSERQILDAVAAARAAGIPWVKIGELLGTSAQAAQQRYGTVVE